MDTCLKEKRNGSLTVGVRIERRWGQVFGINVFIIININKDNYDLLSFMCMVFFSQATDKGSC